MTRPSPLRCSPLWSSTSKSSPGVLSSFGVFFKSLVRSLLWSSYSLAGVVVMEFFCYQSLESWLESSFESWES